MGIDSADPWGLPPEDDLETVAPVIERAATETAEALEEVAEEATEAVVEEAAAEIVTEATEAEATEAEATEAEATEAEVDEAAPEVSAHEAAADEDAVVAAAALADEAPGLAETPDAEATATDDTATDETATGETATDEAGTIEIEVPEPEAGDAELVTSADEHEPPSETDDASVTTVEAATEEAAGEETAPEATAEQGMPAGGRPMSPLMAAAAGLFGGRKPEATPEEGAPEHEETPTEEAPAEEAAGEHVAGPTDEGIAATDTIPAVGAIGSVDLEDEELPDELPAWAAPDTDTAAEAESVEPEVELIEIVEETEEEVVEVIEIEPPEEDLDAIVSQLAATVPEAEVETEPEGPDEAPSIEIDTGEAVSAAMPIETEDIEEEPTPSGSTDAEPVEEAVLEPAVTESLGEAAAVGGPPSVYGELAELGAQEAETPGPGEARDTESGTEGGVVWGARWREAAQGWVEGEDGSSTWRPIVATVDALSDWDVDTYLGIVAGEAPMAEADARGVAQRRMVDEAMARGAHAVIGVRFIMGTDVVTAYGTAVTLKGSD